MQCKQFLLLAATLLLCSAPVSAQQAWAGRTSLKVGPSFSSFWGDTKDANFENRTGISAGIELSFPLGNGFAIQPEALYTQKGARASGIEDDYKLRVEYDLDYIEIPVLVSITTPSEGFLHGRLYIGPFIAALLHDDVRATYAGIEVPRNLLRDFTPENGFSPVDAGGIIGIGGLFYFTDHLAFTFDARLVVGGIPLDWDDRDFMANRSLSLSFGLAL